MAAAIILSPRFTETSSAADNDIRQSEHWLFEEMELAHSIQPGMTAEQLLAIFRRENGIVWALTEDAHKGTVALARTYALRNCTCIKIEVRFRGSDTVVEATPGAIIEWVSKPYLEHEFLD